MGCIPGLITLGPWVCRIATVKAANQIPADTDSLPISRWLKRSILSVRSVIVDHRNYLNRFEKVVAVIRGQGLNLVLRFSRNGVSLPELIGEYDAASVCLSLPFRLYSA